MYTLNIETLYKGTIDLHFKNFENFVWVAGHQIGILRGYVDNTKEYCETVSKDYSKRFQEKETLGVFENLTSDSIIVDIGSGVGVFDLILYKYLNGGHYVLVDKNEINHDHTVSHWSEGHGFYNNWDVFNDIATNSNIPLSNFALQTPNDCWPESIDLIMSHYSYMWHYPKQVYWDKIKKHSASLCFDILNRKENIMEQINAELNQVCVYKEKPSVAFHWFKKDLLLENSSPGKVCFWK